MELACSGNFPPYGVVGRLFIKDAKRNMVMTATSAMYLFLKRLASSGAKASGPTREKEILFVREIDDINVEIMITIAVRRSTSILSENCVFTSE